MDISQAYVPQKQIRARLGIPSRAAAGLPVLLGIIPYALVLGAQAAQKASASSKSPDDRTELCRRIGIRSHPALDLAAACPADCCDHLSGQQPPSADGRSSGPFIRHLPKRKAFASLFLMCDESWALGLADAKRRQSKGVNPALSLTFYAGVAIPFYLAWVLFTTLGAAFGPMMGDLRPYGFDMAFPAVFLVLLAGMWKGFAAARPWLVSLVVAALTYLTIPGAWYVAAGALSGLVAAYLLAGEE